jgi:hypothetical protein
VEVLLERLRTTPGCVVRPPRGQPELRPGLALPGDLVSFYELCGGVLLSARAALPLRVSGADELVPAAPRLLTEELAASELEADPSSVVSTCFVIVDNGTGGATDRHVVIDLHPARLGRCYETFWDRFGLAGDMPVVAAAFGDLLAGLTARANAGVDDLLSDWPTLGDAYDDPDLT